MKTMLTYCGLECGNCPVHLATLEKDKFEQQKMRVSIAEQCAKIYGIEISAADVNDCDGCKSGADRLFTGCKDCEIRKCAMLKNIENCAYCTDYACDILEKHFTLDPGAKKRLEKIRDRNFN